MTRNHLLEEPTLLDDISNGFLLDTSGLVYILEGVELLRLFVLNDSNLRKSELEEEDRERTRERL